MIYYESSNGKKITEKVYRCLPAHTKVKFIKKDIGYSSYSTIESDYDSSTIMNIIDAVACCVSMTEYASYSTPEMDTTDYNSSPDSYPDTSLESSGSSSTWDSGSSDSGSSFDGGSFGGGDF